MIKSMTGFGLANAENESLKVSVEIKSLNSKFLEIGIKMPKIFSDKELMLRNLCTKEIERGKVNVTISVEQKTENAKGASIDVAMFKKYHTQLAALATEYGEDIQSLIPTILSLPDVLIYNEINADSTENELLIAAFNTALANFNQFRIDEGKVLQADLIVRVENILNYFAEIEKIAPLRVPQIRERLNQYLTDAVGKSNIDQNRFEQELIYYIDKLDITEEQTRLKSHCNYFDNCLKSKEASGKKLGFIAQEMGREINTTGSKANDAEMQKLVVGMKEELEKIKEQLLNIL